ncbi:MAG: hypothetical protein JWL62_1679 [Hyphomicrobiales bacterium]|nr:hypothetical protein [Hyphomicrobiales bacterium]
MTRSAWIILAATLVAQGASAQSAGSGPAGTAAETGHRLFNQSCGVCHTLPTLTSGRYGPALSKESLGGLDEAMTQVISQGTARMPGFSHHFSPAQIQSIVAYLKTVPVPPPDAPMPKTPERRDDN